METLVRVRCAVAIVAIVAIGFGFASLGSFSAGAVINNGGGAAGKDVCQANYKACIRHCQSWYPTAKESNACEERTCWPQLVACNNRR